MLFQSKFISDIPVKEDQKRIVSNNRSQLSFSRSLNQLKWHKETKKFSVTPLPDQGQQYIEQKKIQKNFRVNKQVTPFITPNIRRPIIIQNPLNPETLKLSKHISKLYDCYPVTSGKDQQSNESLPFIPSEVLLKPRRLDPKFKNIYIPTGKQVWRNQNEQIPQFSLQTQLVQVKNKLQKELESIRYLKENEEEDSLPFTTLKDYLDSQSKLQQLKPYVEEADDLVTVEQEQNQYE